MLPVLSGNRMKPTRWTALGLLLFAAIACAVPTVWNAPVLADPPEATSVLVVTEEPVTGKVEVEIELKNLAEKIAAQAAVAEQQKAIAEKAKAQAEAQKDQAIKLKEQAVQQLKEKGYKPTTEKPLLERKLAAIQKPGDSDERLERLERQLQELAEMVKSMKSMKGEVPNPATTLKLPSKLSGTIVTPPQPAADPAAPATPKYPASSLTPPPKYSAANPIITQPSGNFRLETTPDGARRVMVYSSDDKPTRWLVTPGSSDGKTVTLVRAEYKLSHDKAVALEKFLKENVKSDVLEIKVDGEELTVTSTPDQQAGISQLVRLLQPAEHKAKISVEGKSGSLEVKPEPKK